MVRAAKEPLIWAREIQRQQQVGQMRPHKEMADKKDEAKVRGSMKPELISVAIKTIVRGENETRVRALIRAQRLLANSADAEDKRLARTLSLFLANEWGIRKAYEVVAQGDVDDMKELREKWGDVQLPPPDALCGTWVADELLIAATVRRIS